MMVADRIVQLDHMTRGRVMFGAGPGLLASDAIMMGIDPMTQRDRMAESLDAILRLFRGEIVTEKTDWYTMEGCRLHLLPYTKPYPEVAVVSAVTPSGGRLAGKYDLGMICVAATNPFGFDALGSNWQIACDVAAEHGRAMDPNRLRLVGPMHIAETREQAFANARFGFERYLGYLNNNQPRFIVPAGKDPLEWFVENRYGVCGTPDDAIALIERLQDKQGEFGAFLHQAHNWADFEATKRSYELYARYVMPHFSRLNAAAPPPINGAATTAPSSAPSATPPPRRCSTSTKPSRRRARPAPARPPRPRPRSLVTGTPLTEGAKAGPTIVGGDAGHWLSLRAPAKQSRSSEPRLRTGIAASPSAPRNDPTGAVVAGQPAPPVGTLGDPCVDEHGAHSSPAAGGGRVACRQKPARRAPCPRLIRCRRAIPPSSALPQSPCNTSTG